MTIYTSSILYEIILQYNIITIYYADMNVVNISVK